ncbi:Gfo/Idh/MocA family oxidoreductase [Cellulomonas composti]|uniref:Oxidoreductase n=1 Tax=Cellulomonas composti TaxID=266130 RepID=A0A511J9G5_9CELL|nr:Gfo/Idh/MocA family oxidoreductase [Cellulomonas composti]GEL94637.1 oxidoreductase [Cellulomonas composti]
MAISTVVVGFGLAGRVFHAPLIDADPDYSLDAIVTSSDERVAAASARYPGARVVPDLDALLRDGRVPDLAVVATPNDSHVALARRLLEGGVDVVVDKPLAPRSAEAAALVVHARELGRRLTVFQNRRWDGDFRTVRDLVAGGELGEVLQFESAFGWWSPTIGASWRDRLPLADGGGVLFDLGPHLIDQAIALFGPVESIHAELDQRRAGAVNDDDSFVALTHRSGVRSRLWMSVVLPEQRPRFRVTGRRAVATSWGLDPQEPQLADGVVPDDPAYGIHGEHPTIAVVSPDTVRHVPKAAGDYPAFYRELAAALRDGGPLPVDPTTSVEVIELMERAIDARA